MTTNQIIFSVFAAFWALLTVIALFQGKLTLTVLFALTCSIFYYIVQYCPQYH